MLCNIVFAIITRIYAVVSTLKFYYSVWEGQAGKTAADMQAFIDGPNGPTLGCMDNTVFGPVDSSIANLGYTPFFGSASPLSPAPIKGSTIYMIQHHIKQGKGEAMFAKMDKLMSDPLALASMTSKHKAQGFHNHTFMPVKGKTEGLFATCIWEAKGSVSAKTMQEMIDAHDGVGSECCENKIFVVDASKANIGLAQFFDASAVASVAS